jgi:hypothetical protein
MRSMTIRADQSAGDLASLPNRDRRHGRPLRPTMRERLAHCDLRQHQDAAQRLCLIPHLLEHLFLITVARRAASCVPWAAGHLAEEVLRDQPARR